MANVMFHARSLRLMLAAVQFMLAHFCSASFAQQATDEVIQRGKVYAGGVSGFRDMLDAKGSDDFRKHGGGLFLHNSAWGKIDVQERRRVLDIFSGQPVAIEIGYDKSGKTDWAHWLKGAYIDLGIRPHFVTVNIFANKNVPTVEEWRAIHDKLKAKVPDGTLVVPTFECANFGVHRDRLVRDRLSVSRPFQEIVEIAGGLTIDAPPRVLLNREQAYRDWVVDALRFARRKQLMSALIVSPNQSASRFPSDALRAVNGLKSAKAAPDILIVENYVEAASNYPNRVGNDRNPVTTLGLANRLLKTR